MKPESHPTFTHASLLADICKPLERFNINTFSHVHCSNNLEMTYLRNQPAFTKIYHSKNYHLADIHTASGHFGEFILWNDLSCSGKTNNMLKDVTEAGYHQFFTIIEKDATGSHFYHFATDTAATNMSQLYLSNIDALKAFVRYFKNTVKTAKELLSWREIKFKIENKHNDIALPSDQIRISNDHNREAFFREISFENERLQLSPQQLKCFQALVKGSSIKQISTELNLTYRTVEHYLRFVRTKLKCRSTNELIARYAGQVN